MKTVILCGGLGTRIRDVADNIPKPMISVGNFPILWHIMKYYSSFNYNDFILCLGYKGQVIKDFFLNYEAHTNDFTITLGSQKPITYHSNHSEAGWGVTLADTGQETMTGGRVKRAQKYVQGEENFMLTYGDGVGDINIEELVKFHKAHGKIMTITGVRPPGRFGEIMSDSNGLISEFNEKPQASGGRISGGFFVCNYKVFDYLDDRENLIFEQEPMRKLVKDGQLMVYEHNGFWQPMDTYRDYQFLNGLYDNKKAPWVVW
ncbi:MAG: glucose-1-phosphate cytidylyltransferase [Spirochaetia bacterium]|nr:glucose-1-phosphate cytidylyltransferase [Spirochaetia bacterium]